MVKRYFNNESSVRCFACGESGHMSGECSSRKNENCLICLDNHRYDQCPRQICGQCNKRGHNYRNCPTYAAYIFKYKPNDLLTSFSIKGRSSIPKMNASDMLCISCGEYGHANCKLSSRVKDNQKFYLLPIQIKDNAIDLTAIPDKYRLQCANCGSSSHSYVECKNRRVEDMVRNFRKSQETCFKCWSEGHQQDVCPKFQVHQNKRSRFSNSPRTPNFNSRWEQNSMGDYSTNKRRRYSDRY